MIRQKLLSVIMSSSLIQLRKQFSRLNLLSNKRRATVQMRMTMKMTKMKKTTKKKMMRVTKRMKTWKKAKNRHRN